jgi:insertion element IS1 protein InsB
VRSQAEPAWVWVVLDRHTRPVLACVWGDRNEKPCRSLWEPVPAPCREAAGYTNFWEAYRAVIPEAQQVAVGKESGETAPVEG